ncbi:LLM class flavin-dependent oxidoreductase [Actinokineospora sp. NBRC 105648]|uniref:LLM class flavin-dependent oxidoreductase n=1 Tax=Actinokineospora sp. NBRC 105648 TaxID=3032206 RepID=UPI0024A447D5|nr:LLM class flavin-dependent oxidoreductase [Actinokineospora sp. NBRC 105648]GLZ43134.1 monooxygenase [Actinokineospora sp. NBRC 105648]
MSLYLALEADGAGAHPAAWRFSAEVLRPAGVKVAEAAGIALVTFADSPVPPGGFPGRLEAVGRAAFLSTRTKRIGLGPAVPTATTEPFHVAAQLASLDHASRGRAAWVVTGSTAEELATVGTTGPPGEAADVVRVVRALWDSWEDDAIIKDVATGRFLDPAKVHHVDFEGATFSVKGPLITPRPPQGQPVVVAAEGLGVDADITLVTAPKAGPGLVFAELDVVLDTDEPAADRLGRLDDAEPWHSTRIRHVGSAAGLVRLLDELRGAVDGVRLHLAELALDLPVLAEHVLPALDLPPQRETLRATLGLGKPANRFAATGGGSR